MEIRINIERQYVILGDASFLVSNLEKTQL
jgi:hypothetical protein